jgi:hypothetical protein
MRTYACTCIPRWSLIPHQKRLELRGEYERRNGVDREHLGHLRRRHIMHAGEPAVVRAQIQLLVVHIMTLHVCAYVYVYVDMHTCQKSRTKARFGIMYECRPHNHI